MSRLENAHRARRGQRETFATRSKRAATRERQTAGSGPFGGSPYEEQLAVYLNVRKIPYIPQAAFGSYNVDFLLKGDHSIAIEIHGGSKDESARRSRLEYLIDGPGLSVVEIFVGKWCQQPRVTVDAAAFAVQFHHEMQRKALYASVRDVATAERLGIDVREVESERVAEHRMIWGDGSIREGPTYPFLD